MTIGKDLQDSMTIINELAKLNKEKAALKKCLLELLNAEEEDNKTWNAAASNAEKLLSSLG